MDNIDGTTDLVDVRDDLQGKIDTLNTDLTDTKIDLQDQIDVIDAALPDLTPLQRRATPKSS
jgi:hypothetical protein